jgi:hypothetical protein
MRSTRQAPGCATFHTTRTRALGRSRQATTAGSVATPSTPSTSPRRRTRYGQSGTGISPNVAYRPCTSFRAITGATESRGSTSPTSRRPTASPASVSAHRHLAAGPGLRIRRWVKRSGAKAGPRSSRRVPPAPTASFSASSSRIRRSCRQSQSHPRVSSQSRQRRPPECAREDVATGHVTASSGEADDCLPWLGASSAPPCHGESRAATSAVGPEVRRAGGAFVHSAH